MNPNAELQLLFETMNHKYLRSLFQGTEVVFIQSLTNPSDLYVSVESMAKIMGYDSTEAMFGDDNILDAISQYMRVTGNSFPVCKIQDGNAKISTNKE